MINGRHIDIPKLAEELYTPSNPGGVILRGFLRPYRRRELACEIGRYAKMFRRRPREYGRATQELEGFEVDCDAYADDGFEALFWLRGYAAGIWKALAKEAGFAPYGFPNYIAVQRYWKGSIGITPHRDESENVNLISIFVITGAAPFGICFDRKKSHVIDFSPSPGDLILLRAPRVPDEKVLRPLHYVGEVTKERITVTLREKRK